MTHKTIAIRSAQPRAARRQERSGCPRRPKRAPRARNPLTCSASDAPHLAPPTFLSDPTQTTRCERRDQELGSRRSVPLGLAAPQPSPCSATRRSPARAGGFARLRRAEAQMFEDPPRGHRVRHEAHDVHAASAAHAQPEVHLVHCRFRAVPKTTSFDLPPARRAVRGEEKGSEEPAEGPPRVRGDDGAETRAACQRSFARGARRAWCARAATRPPKEPAGDFEEEGMIAARREAPCDRSHGREERGAVKLSGQRGFC